MQIHADPAILKSLPVLSEGIYFSKVGYTKTFAFKTLFSVSRTESLRFPE